MIVIADTSPLNYLVLIGEAEVLRRLYGQVVIPEAVLREL
jgi:predicted nucleic acid-binding protein